MNCKYTLPHHWLDAVEIFLLHKVAQVVEKKSPTDTLPVVEYTDTDPVSLRVYLCRTLKHYKLTSDGLQQGTSASDGW